MTKTLIITLQINNDAAEYFTNLRTQHFPAEINHLSAHLTLFHKLPDEDQVFERLQALCCKQNPFEMMVAEIRSIGNGVAFKVESAVLSELHARMQESFKPYLIPQDQQRLWPHITIQNKVSAEVANSLLNSLKQEFSPFTIEAQGLAVWEYLGGPWSLLKTYDFSGY